MTTKVDTSFASLSQRLFTLAAPAFLVASTLPAAAHPGHSLHDASPAHLLTSPDHLLVLIASGIAMLTLARLIPSRWLRRAVSGAGTVALLSAAVLWGMRS